MQQARPDDAITLREAAKFTGKSLDTLRRWRRSKGLTEWRDPGSTTAPVLVSKSEVLRIAGAVATPAHTAAPHAHIAAAPKVDTANNAVFSSMQAHIGSLEGTIEDLRKDRDELRVELRTARQDIEERDKRIQALQNELNGNSKGLLRSAWSLLKK